MLGFRTLNRDDRFCCLGVACEVAIANGVPLNKQKKSLVLFFLTLFHLMMSVHFTTLDTVISRLRLEYGWVLKKDKISLSSMMH